ncbi:MAG: metallophosphoesterase family protein [Kiritimatiellae bacterium]|nr:metallophosphoesterase family protein [Kiritimatiellia bacterium]
MRIAFIADVHANLPALEAVIADARTHGATHLLCLGDIIGYGPQPIETLARIREVASGVLLGNHDAAAAEMLDLQLFNPFAKETAERAILALDDDAKAYLRGLPNMLEVKNIACAHSCFDAPETFRYLETKEDAARSLDAMPNFTLLVVGHTHVPCLFVRETPEGPVRKLPPESTQLRQGHRYVVNPGSVGFPRTDDLTADYLIYDTLMRRLIFRSVAYDLTPYRLALVRNGYNPLNYWFLSPSARKRQTELALRNPAPQAPSPLGDSSPFKPVKKPYSRKLFFAICTALLVILLLLTSTVLTRLHATATEPPRNEHYNPNNLLPPLQTWVLPRYPFTLAEPPENAIQLTPVSTEAQHHILHSQLIRVLKDTRKLRFSFHTVAEAKHPGLHTVVAEFIDANGNRKRDRIHTYRTTGYQSYTIRVPREATALRIQFDFALKAPLKLLNPELEPIRE